MSRTFATTVRTIGAAALVAAAALSCPNPIDEELLLVVEDELGPDLVVTAPAPNSYYHGVITVTGNLSDSSSTAGDGAGRLASLTFSVSDASLLGFRVAFDPTGNATVTSGSTAFSWDPSTGDFSFDLPTATLDGYRVLSFVASDARGNEARDDLALVEYPFGPDLQLASPANLSFYDMIVSIAGTVTDTAADATTDEVRKLEVRVEGETAFTHTISLDTMTPDPDGVYRAGTLSFDPSNGAFADYYDSSGDSLEVYVTVTAWNVGSSSATTVRLRFNGTGPAISFDPPAGGHNPPYYSSEVTPSIVIDGTVDTTNLDPGTVRYKVVQNPGSPVGAFFAPNPSTGAFSFTFSTATLAGNLTVEVHAKDNRGVESMAELPIYDDTTPPGAPDVSGPATPTNDSTPLWTWTTPADTADFQYSTAGASGPWTATTATFYEPAAPLGEGPHTLWVRARDALGNPSDADSYTLTVDTVAPGAPTVSGPASPTNDDTPTWTWTVSGDTVESRHSLTSATGPWTTTTGTSYTPTLGEGTHTLWVEARDAAGNWSASDSAPVTIDLTPPSAPSVTGPPSPTNDTTPTWTWTVSGDTVQSRYSLTSTTGPWTTTAGTSYTPTLGEGTHTLWVQARDAAGNWSASDSANVVIDLTPPAAPNVTGPPSPTNDTTPTWTWTVSGDTVQSRYSLTSTTGPWTTTTDTSYTPTLGAGTHTLWVQARDAAGNWSASDSASVTIDLTPPSAPNVTGPASPTNDTTPTWTWNTPSGTVEFRHSLTSATGPWTTTTDTSYTPTLGEGSYTLWVEGRDAAGNWSASDSASVTIDLTPPAAPSVTGTASPTDDTTPTWTWDTPADATGFRRSLDGAAWVTTGSNSWTASPPFNPGETHTLEVQARDSVGNWSASGSYTIQINP